MNLRERQKYATLNAIKDTAREIFSSRQYESISVDEIAKSSGVSRGTIYKHFRSKLEIVMSIVEDDLERHRSAYALLANLDDVCFNSVRSWFEDFVEKTKSSNKFLATYFRSHNDGFPLIVGHRNKVIEILGRKFEGFRVGRYGVQHVEQCRAQCFMMLFLIETGAITYAIETDQVDRNIGMDLTAEALVGFLKMGELYLPGTPVSRC
ncbi:TetR/AcrR family transcriptional regulator [Novosphingobium sp. M1R2S20]|uniref:TetR/AcrR family transcriptional regulator n=1 Tax=Novosphingobium rhizovicinum TaxID=3228928 RepID=A0ABV3RBG5_9SPHN